MQIRWTDFLAATAFLAFVAATTAAQTIDIKQLVVDLKVAEQEEAAAKEVRLKWINDERARIQSERKKLETELEALRQFVPDPVKPRVVAPAVERERQRERLQADGWAINNNPQLNAAIMKGSGINSLLRVLGPIAHYRRLKATSPDNSQFPSLRDRIRADEASHYLMSPATSAGSKVIVRLNQSPLELRWPAIVWEQWTSDCRNLQNIRDKYVEEVRSTVRQGTPAHLATAELFDKSVELLQAKILQKKSAVPGDNSLTSHKRNQIHRELQDALRYLETIRATAERFRSTPEEFKIHEFAGGSIEDFLDFAYTHGMIFGEARPADESSYLKLLRRMQDYAYDIQYVEDWKSDLDQRIRELDDTDQKLIFRASER